MSISAKQFDYLSAMGIELWQRKSQGKPQETQPDERSPQLLTISLETLSKQPLFQDMLLAFNCPLEQIALQDNTLILHELKWGFVNVPQITFAQGILLTPSLTAIAQSAKLKKALWQLIQTKLLIQD